MYDTELSKKTEGIYDSAFKRRLNPDSQYKGWTFESFPGSGKARPRIRQLLLERRIVRAGYFCTGVRGFREYYIYHKERRSK